MGIRSRRVAVALCSLLAVTSAPAAVADGRIRPTSAGNSVSDPKGDVTNDEGGAVGQPEADIVSTAVEHRGGDVVFTLLVDRPTDPNTTKNWEGGTLALWGVETSGDTEADYLVAFGRNESGQLAVRVARLDGTGDPCDGQAGLGPNGEFMATVPTGCLGDPASFRYAAGMSWDTDPANENASAVSDSAPDGDNLAGPVAKP